MIKTLRTTRRALKEDSQRRRFEALHKKFREFTMVAPFSYANTLSLVERVHDIPGIVVECGVWRGGMSAGIASILGPDRRYFLFDSFEGLPPAKAADGESAKKYQADKKSPTYYDNCSAEPDFAQRAMRLAGAKSVTLIKGWFNETLPKFPLPEPIAVLRLDGDWYESTMTCLDALFDQVTPGGLIFIDDYFNWEGCAKALHDFLSKRSAPERIQTFRDICFIEKRDPKNPERQLRFFPLQS